MERDGSRGAGNHAASRDYRFLWIRLGLGSFGTGLGKKPLTAKTLRPAFGQAG